MARSAPTASLQDLHATLRKVRLGVPMTRRPSVDPGALLARTYPMPGGQRVRLRLLRSADAPAVGDLLDRVGIEVDELALQRLGRFDPRERVAIAAVSPRPRGEAMLGLGTIERSSQARPDFVVADPECGQELEGLIASALVARARRAA
jgi:hypothetical protein